MSEPTLANLLANLGLDEDQASRFADHLPVVYPVRTETDPGIGLIHWIDDGRLRSGIIEVFDPGNGLKAFGRFRTRTRKLAEYLGLAEFELFGAEIINAKLERILIGQGFDLRFELIPDELGDLGEMPVYSKIFSVR